MAYGVETLATPRGTRIDFEVHKSPLGVAGVVAHWGEKILDADLQDRIRDVFPDKPLQENSGFDAIYHQADGITREQGIADELEVARLVISRTMEANGWEPKDIAGLFLGSGVPIEDDPRYKNYAQVIAKEVGLSPDAYLHTTYAACASGGHELINALSNPEMHGKPVIVMAMEGISYLTADFDPINADALSMRFFSNGAAGIGVVPGENMSLLTSSHKVVPDTKRALSAIMTYEDLMDKDGDTWQEKDTLSIIKVPTPEGGKRITMGARTGPFFLHHGIEMVIDLARIHEENLPGVKADYGVSHHPSKTIFEHFGEKLKEEGIGTKTPWVVRDGNSSAATSIIAEVRQLDMAREGTVQLLSTYGAGGSFDGAYILNAGELKNLK